MADNDPIVRLGYTSSENISFAGTVETGYTRSEWDLLSEKEKEACFEQSLWELVDIFELSDDEPDYSSYSRWRE